MRTSKNILTEKEMELVELLMQDCQSTGEYSASYDWRCEPACGKIPDNGAYK